MSDYHIINVSCNGITSKGHIFNNFDYEVIDSMYKTADDYDHPIVYNFLYKYILTLPNDKKIVTLSPDPVISGSTMCAIAEKYMYSNQVQDNTNFLSKLHIIYITSSPHLLNNYSDITVENLRNSLLSHVLSLRPITFMGSKLALSKDQITLIGINDNLLENDEREVLDNMEMSYFTMKQLRKKGIKNVIKSINEKIGSDPFMVVYDMASLSYETAPCVSRFLKDGIKTNPKLLNGFDEGELRELFLELKRDNLVALDITGFDFRIENKERAYRISCESAKIPLYILLEMKEKKINIFNEHSRFLIFRPIEQTHENDLGWFILKGLNLESRNEIIKNIPNDTIIDFTIDLEGTNETILLTTTTIEEQEEKSFFDPDLKITDCVLYPAQKTYMMFELLNTPQNSIHS